MTRKALSQEPCEDAISRAEAIRVASGYCHPSNIAKELDKLPPINPQEKVGHCEDCKYFRKLPYHTDTLGKCVHYKCVHHKGFCPKGDYWYCADFEPQESEE